MKNIIMVLCILAITASSGFAQSVNKSNSNSKKTTAAVKKPVKKKSINSGSSAKTTSITATSSYNAKSIPPISIADRFTISDTLINSLNARARGSDIQISNSGIVGMPKRAYGFRNGRLILHSSGATTSGTMTGTGSVGTGSSLGTIGSGGASIGLNGKSPYAGSTMWGNATGLLINQGDTAVRLPLRNQK